MKSKNKGKRGELEAARLLSAWWMGNPVFRNSKAEALPIRRTPLSGGWASAKGVGGDLVAVHEDAKDFSLLSVEVKNQEAWDFDGMLKNVAWPIYGWWKQCCEAAKKSKALPLLIFTKNHHPFYFCIHKKHWTKLRTGGLDAFNVMRWRGRVFGLLEDLMKHFSKAMFKEAFGDEYGSPER